MRNRALSRVAFGLSLLLCACSGGGGSTVTPGVVPPSSGGIKKPTDVLGGLPSPINVMLGDAAPRLGSLTPTEIDLGISEVDIVSNGTIVPIAQYAAPVVVNVLAEQDHPGSIGVGTVWSGQYQQVRFVVNVASSKVVANGTNYPITFRTAASSISASTVASTGSSTVQSLDAGSVGMTVSGSFVDGGSPADAVEADFNAFESLKISSAGNIVALPTLFAVAADRSGKISGSLVNAQGAGVNGATIVAFDANNHVANTDNTDAAGAFNMHTLAAGTYHLVVYNSYRTAVGQAINATNESNPSSTAPVDAGYVTVVAGQTTTVPSVND